MLDVCASLHSLESYNDGLKAIFIHEEKYMYSVILNEKSPFLDLMYSSKLGTYYWMRGIEQSVEYTNDVKIVTLQVYNLSVEGICEYEFNLVKVQVLDVV